jgi:hypothetical protein
MPEFPVSLMFRALQLQQPHVYSDRLIARGFGDCLFGPSKKAQ